MARCNLFSFDVLWPRKKSFFEPGVENGCINEAFRVRDNVNFFKA
jgi:hypothetical protein